MRIEELKFAHLTERYLLKKGYETLEDLTKIEYDELKKEGNLYNSIINRVHQNGLLMDFEIHYNNIIKKRLKNGEHIKIDELSISENTKRSLKKINVDYIEELVFVNDDMLQEFKIGELKEIKFIIGLLGINKSKTSSLKNSNILKKYDVKLSEKTYSELRALNMDKLKDYLYISDKQKELLSSDSREELETLINNTYNDVETTKLEIEVEDLETEINQLHKLIDIKERQIDKLNQLRNHKISLENRLADVNKQLKKTITECSK